MYRMQRTCCMLSLLGMLAGILLGIGLIIVGVLWIVLSSNIGVGCISFVISIFLVVLPTISYCGWNNAVRKKYILKTNLLPILSIFFCGIFGVAIAYLWFTKRDECLEEISILEKRKNKDNQVDAKRDEYINSMIKKFEEMHKSGMITKEELEAKKNSLLRKREFK